MPEKSQHFHHDDKGRLIEYISPEAKSHKKLKGYARDSSEVCLETKRRVISNGGDPNNEWEVCQEIPLQYGKYKGKTQ